MELRDSYDAVAAEYAEHFANELEGKPLDRHLLNRFAESTRDRGTVLELGCGPGQVARYLADQGVSVTGVDLSPRMIEQAQRAHPHLAFRVGDMTALSDPHASIAGIVAFYAICHTPPAELAALMRELRRVMAGDALCLLAFHIGDQRIHTDEFFGQRVNLDYYFHEPAHVIGALSASGLRVIEHVEREAYEGAEYGSRRCYLLSRAI